jgi:hypothetical protein
LVCCTVTLGGLRLRHDALLDVAETGAGLLGRVGRRSMSGNTGLSMTSTRHQVMAGVMLMRALG